MYIKGYANRDEVRAFVMTRGLSVSFGGLKRQAASAGTLSKVVGTCVELSSSMMNELTAKLCLKPHCSDDFPRSTPKLHNEYEGRIKPAGYTYMKTKIEERE